MLGVSLYCFLFFLTQGLLLSLELHGLAWLVGWPASTWYLPISVLQCWGHKSVPLCPVFEWVPGN